MSFRFCVFAALLVICYTGCKEGAGTPTATRPNILVILTDDQQYDAAGFDGNPVIRTPSIDRLAERSLRFSNANVVFALCSPSRAAILTGRYGSANGVLELDSELHPGEQSLAQYLKQAGYRTGMSGKWHLPIPPDSLGFDFYNYFYSNGTYYGRRIVDMGDTLHPQIHCDAYCADRSLDFIRQQTQPDQPFFLFHCTQTPHMDHRHRWPAQDSTKALYRVGEMPVPANRLDDLQEKPPYLQQVRNRTQALTYGYPDSSAIQAHTRDYYAVITEMDDFIGRILEELDKQGIADNTYVFFLSDNGWMLGDHGFTSKVLPYRPSTRIPFMVKGPGIPAGTRDELVANIDLVPTILEMVGLAVPGKVQGKSIRPLFAGTEAAAVREALVYEGLGFYGGAKPNLTVITKDFRYIETYDNDSLSTVNYRELYDQQHDPAEVHNLAADPHYAPLIDQLQKHLIQHRRDVLRLEP